MKRNDALTKILAVIGTVLAWFPILATLVFGVTGTIGHGRLRFDYLMPAELFPFALAGSLLLFWAAIRAKRYHKRIGWGLVAMLVLLFGGQALAVVTGLASGEREPAGWAWAFVMAGIIGYALALVVVSVAGVLLLRDLFPPRKKGGNPIVPAV